MSGKIVSSCLVKPSEIGAKGFLYPIEGRSSLFVKKGVEVEILSYVSGRGDCDLQAVSIENRLVQGSIIGDGIGVYWVEKKNVA